MYNTTIHTTNHLSPRTRSTEREREIERERERDSYGVGCSREEALVIEDSSSIVVPCSSFEAKTFGSLSSHLK
jgi:hypothetical protein